MAATPSLALQRDVFRLFGDRGADTLDRYFAQIEYTAVWCARMLIPRERVRVVIPEGVEDLVVIRGGRFEMRQVKTRDESVGAWSLAELLPILGAQYTRSYAFGSRRFSFHFVSDARADIRGSPQLGSLEALKDVLDLHRRGWTLSPGESKSLRLFRQRLPPRILPHVRPPGQTCDERLLEQFLLETYIDTNEAEFRTPPSLELLDIGLSLAQPSVGHRTLPELRAIYEQLLLLIVRRIREGTDLRTRAIRRSDVLQCCQAPAAEQSPDFSRLFPGQTRLAAKVLHGGFEQDEAKQFRQQLSRTKVRRREIEAMHLGDRVEDLDLAVGEFQRRERRAMSTDASSATPFGPALLERIRPELAKLATRYLPASARPDDIFCQGLLWEQTQRCLSAWHAIVSARRPAALVASPAASDKTRLEPRSVVKDHI